MDQFSEEHSKLLLSKEWLVKIDGQTSTPYLLKFFSSSVDLTCLVLVTDTKSTWSEVLSSKQFARRWCDSNKLAVPLPFDELEEEEAWRAANLDVLAKAHTLGGIMDMSFDVVESRYSDFAFELECDAFKWRWETCFLGHKASAEIISKHLVMPLISVNHLAFASPDPVCELAEVDLEKAVDKMGRSARRTVDTHVRHAMSKPRTATTLRRMTAMFNFIPELPAIFSTAGKPEFSVLPPPKTRDSSQVLRKPEMASPEVSLQDSSIHNPANFPPLVASPEQPNTQPPKPAASPGPRSSLEVYRNDSESATESETDLPEPLTSKDKRKDSSKITSSSSQVPPRTQSPVAKAPSVPRSPDGSDSSPPRPAKKPKPQVSSSDDDSEAERRQRVAQLKRGAGSAAARQGTRQPLKRGAKRF